MNAVRPACKVQSFPQTYLPQIAYNRGMLVLKERITDVPVMSLQTGSQLARTKSPIIDPRQLKIVGFYCEGPGLESNPAILVVEDIREVSGLGFIVDDADVIMTPDDLVRLKPVIGYNFALEGKQVIEQNGHKLGKVVNFTVDTKSFFIMQLSAQPGLMQSWDTAEVLIGRQQIVEVTDTSVVVRTATIKDASPAKKLEHMVTNTFKRRHTQQEVPHVSAGSTNREAQS
jgi:uncharacterized protein YrrD